MKKIQKNDLRLEKEVISRLSQGELTDVRGGAGYQPQTQLNVDCFHPISYDNNCKTLDLANSCQVSCGGGCVVETRYCILKTVEPGSKPLSEGAMSVCLCVE